MDAEPDLDSEELEEKKKLDNVYTDMLIRQKKVIGALESARNTAMVKPELIA